MLTGLLENMIFQCEISVVQQDYNSSFNKEVMLYIKAPSNDFIEIKKGPIIITFMAKSKLYNIFKFLNTFTYENLLAEELCFSSWMKVREA